MGGILVEFALKNVKRCGGRWRMEDERWMVEDGRGTVEDGKWTVDDGGWKLC
ncbi:MAG: hypothetical protein KAS71_16335 [Bacteroidales bacterium]|nr:hypothetical protein [Bacteroidales bacterium]